MGNGPKTGLARSPSTPLHEVSPKLFTFLQEFFEQKWTDGKLSELFTDEDIYGLLALLRPYLGKGK